MDLYFDPDLHPDDTHKSFVDFVKRFELRYDATYPDPPKTSLDASQDYLTLELASLFRSEMTVTSLYQGSGYLTVKSLCRVDDLWAHAQ